MTDVAGSVAPALLLALITEGPSEVTSFEIVGDDEKRCGTTFINASLNVRVVPKQAQTSPPVSSLVLKETF
jgi:hypothetical protein